MSRRGLGSRINTVRVRLYPLPDPAFLAFARAVIAFGGEETTAASAVELARYLEGGRRDL
jgi:hypothetical protein